MDTKHTPGPWIAESHYVGTIDIQTDDNTTLVAILHKHAKNIDAQNANATLIAAAPDLLTALQQLTAGDGHTFQCIAANQDCRPSCQQARAAIAKATQP